MTGGQRALAVAAAFVALAVPGARALQAQPAPWTSTSTTSSSTRDQAASHTRQGQAFFQHADYDRAIGEYQAAFDLSAEPSLIFNIALCHDRMNRPEPALAAFQRYLELAPRGSVADEARNDVARLTPIVARLTAERAAAEARRREQAEQRRQAALEAERRQDVAATRRLRIARYVMIGGGAIAAGGAALHVVAWRTHNRLPDEPDYDTYRGDRRAVATEQKVAYGLYAAGAVTLATGLVLALTTHRPHEGPQVSAALVPGGATMILEWSR